MSAAIIFSDNHCEIWKFDFDDSLSDENTQAIHCLDPLEKARYSNYRSTSLKTRFALSRYLQKKILSQRLKCNLEDVCFEYTSLGKPILMNNPIDLQFNYTDSGRIGLFALSSYPIGIDVEKIQHAADVFDTLDLVMTASEKEWILESSSFFRYYVVWTIKEAYLKCKGMGLGAGLIPDVSLVLSQPLTSFHMLNQSECSYVYTDTLNDYVFSVVVIKPN